MSKKGGRSDKSEQMSMSEESQQSSKGEATSSRRMTRSSQRRSPSPSTTSDPSQEASGKSSSFTREVLRRSTRIFRMKGTPQPGVSSKTDPRPVSTKKPSKLFGLFARKSSVKQQTSSTSAAQASSSTSPPENPPKEILPGLERFKHQSGSPSKTKRRPTESSGTQQAPSPLKRVRKPSLDEPIPAKPQTPEKKMRRTSPTPVIKVTTPGETITPPIYNPGDPAEETADKSTSPMEEFPSLAPTTTSQPPPRRPSPGRVKVVTSRFLADSLSMLVDALRNVERRTTKHTSKLSRCKEDGKFILEEPKQAQTDSKMKQTVDELFENLDITDCSSQQVGDEQKESLTEPSTSSTKSAPAQASYAPSSQRPGDIEIMNPRFETTEQWQTGSEDGSSRQRLVSQTLNLEYREYGGDTIFEVSLTFSPDRVNLAGVLGSEDLWSSKEREEVIDSESSDSRTRSASPHLSPLSETEESASDSKPTPGSAVASSMDVGSSSGEGDASRSLPAPKSSATSAPKMEVVQDESARSSFDDE